MFEFQGGVQRRVAFLHSLGQNDVVLSPAHTVQVLFLPSSMDLVFPLVLTSKAFV